MNKYPLLISADPKKEIILGKDSRPAFCLRRTSSSASRAESVVMGLFVVSNGWIFETFCRFRVVFKNLESTLKHPSNFALWETRSPNQKKLKPLYQQLYQPIKGKRLFSSPTLVVFSISKRACRCNRLNTPPSPKHSRRPNRGPTPKSYPTLALHFAPTSTMKRSNKPPR